MSYVTIAILAISHTAARVRLLPFQLGCRECDGVQGGVDTQCDEVMLLVQYVVTSTDLIL